MGRVTLENWQLGLDARPLGRQTARQQQQNAPVGNQETDVPPPPRQSHQHSGQHIYGQQTEQSGKPTGIIDGEVGRFAAKAFFDPSCPSQNAHANANQRNGQS